MTDITAIGLEPKKARELHRDVEWEENQVIQQEINKVRNGLEHYLSIYDSL